MKMPGIALVIHGEKKPSETAAKADDTTEEAPDLALRDAYKAILEKDEDGFVTAMRAVVEMCAGGGGTPEG